MVFTHLFLVLRSLPSSCWLVSSRHCWLMRPTSEHWRISQTKIRMGSSVRHQRFNNPAHRVLGPKFFCVYPPPFFLQYYDHPIVTMPPPPPPLLPLSPSFIPTFRYHPHPPISHTHNHNLHKSISPVLYCGIMTSLTTFFLYFVLWTRIVIAIPLSLCLSLASLFYKAIFTIDQFFTYLPFIFDVCLFVFLTMVLRYYHAGMSPEGLCASTRK